MSLNFQLTLFVRLQGRPMACCGFADTYTVQVPREVELAVHPKTSFPPNLLPKLAICRFQHPDTESFLKTLNEWQMENIEIGV